MKTLTISIVLVSILGVTMMSCAKETPKPKLDPRVVQAHNRFGFNLFAGIYGEQAENLMISPTSVMSALCMTWNGAAGETKAGMAEVLELQGLSVDEVNRGNLALMQALREFEDVELLLANSLWMREGSPFEDGFLERNRGYYDARIEALDFDDPEAPSIMNAWVSDQTRGMIPKIIDGLSPDAVLVLLNAIYFKGLWTDPFDPEITRDHPFTRQDGSTIRVPMMMKSGDFSYFEEEDVQAVRLPYGEGWVNLYVFLPGPDSDLIDLLDGLDLETWNAWLSEFSEREGSLGLPRFEFDYEKTLNDVLSALGMGMAFDPSEAEFREMSPLDPLFIALVKHKSRIEVNEEGTEAAAATGVVMEMAAAPEEKFRMTCDRPFLFAIADNKTGAILFLGTVAEPM
jgi:serpin B